MIKAFSKFLFIVFIFILITSCSSKEYKNKIAELEVDIEKSKTENELMSKRLKKKEEEIEELKFQIEKVNTQKNKKALIKRKRREEKETVLASVELVKVQTGFDPYYSGSDGLWLPTITMMFKNNSSSIISDYIDVKAIFIDNSTGEQISEKTRYISSKNEPFLVGMKKQLPVRSTLGWYGGIKNKDISVKIFIEDVYYDAYKITGNEFNGRIQ